MENRFEPTGLEPRGCPTPGACSCPRDTQFPVHFEGHGLRVFTNPSGEVFVENIGSGVVMRLSARGNSIQFTTSSSINPVRITNMIGWQIGGPA